MNESQRRAFRRFVGVVFAIVATAVLAIALVRQISTDRHKTLAHSEPIEQANPNPFIAVNAKAAKGMPHAIPSSPSPNSVARPGAYSFGPVREATLSSDFEGNDCLLDLDTCRIMTPVEEMRPERLLNPALGLSTQACCAMVWRAYLYGLGVDLVNEEHLRGLRHCGMKLEPLEDDNQWDSLSAVKCARKFEPVFRDLNPLNEGTIVWKTLPSTWLFMTREGGCGVLQISEVQQKPKRVTLRYKLVSNLGHAAWSNDGDVKTNVGEW